MTSQTDSNRLVWRRFLIGGMASGALAAGLLVGVSAPPAFAQPADPAAPSPAPDGNCTGDDCSKQEVAAAAAAAGCEEDDKECAEEAAAAPRVNADEVLSQIYAEYAQGDGGGQISKLIDDAMKLRAQGFRPSNANATALVEALEYRPNQTPLVEALKETIAFQRKLQAQAQMSVSGGGPVPVIPSPSGGITIPAG